jgi:hypothetical protein
MPDLDQSARLARADDVAVEWQSIATAPFGRDLELAVINYDGRHALVFPCRRILGGWTNAETHKPVIVYPTHSSAPDGSATSLQLTGDKKLKFHKKWISRRDQ